MNAKNKIDILMSIFMISVPIIAKIDADILIFSILIKVFVVARLTWISYNQNIAVWLICDISILLISIFLIKIII